MADLKLLLLANGTGLIDGLAVLVADNLSLTEVSLLSGDSELLLESVSDGARGNGKGLVHEDFRHDDILLEVDVFHW